MNPDDPQSAIALDDYFLVNLRMSYEPPSFTSDKFRRPIKLSLYVKNLFDEDAVETLTGTNNRIAGRNFFGSIEYRF